MVKIIETSPFYDFYYIKSKDSYLHISLDNLTFCKQGANAVLSHCKTTTEDKFQNICFICLNQAYNICNITHKIKFSDLKCDLYIVSWRCNFMIKKNKKECRCSKETESAYDTFCTQHYKCYFTRLNKYITTESICDLIINLM